MRDDFLTLPKNLPVPQDDGACRHLEGMAIPAIELRATSGRVLELSQLTLDPTILFFYPRTGRPDEPVPVDWDEIPGARGCTPQSCGFRDLYKEFRAHGYQVFGVSTQTTEYQREFAERMRIPFEILSDSEFKLTTAMKLPTFEFSGMRLLKRMAWVCEDSHVKKVFYPVFPPDENAVNVLKWLDRIRA
jgi:peroxiredoxin